MPDIVFLNMMLISHFLSHTDHLSISNGMWTKDNYSDTSTQLIAVPETVGIPIPWVDFTLSLWHVWTTPVLDVISNDPQIRKIIHTHFKRIETIFLHITHKEGVFVGGSGRGMSLDVNMKKRLFQKPWSLEHFIYAVKKRGGSYLTMVYWQRLFPSAFSLLSACTGYFTQD